MSKVSLKQNNKKSLVLASSSPQRLHLLKQIGIIPDKIEPANLAEKIFLKEKPHEYVLRISKEKANVVSKRNAQSFIIACDTVAALGRRILGKPGNKEEAEKFLMMLSGRRHKVLSAVTLITPENKEISKISITVIKFSRLSKLDLENYIKSNEWKGRAGGYAIQGLAASFIPWIKGSYSSVVGLPITDIKNMLLSSGWKT